jgi:hypothetical protein
MTTDQPVDIAAIYFPSWHADPRRDAHLGEGFTEWDLVRAGRPRFEGHHQPIVPLAGHRDESHPEVMRNIVATAAGAGVTAFLWDWYWYDGSDFLNRPLDEAYLALEQPGVSFALMWANHDWKNVFPATTSGVPDQWWPGAVDAAEFERMTDAVIERYLLHPSHWRVGGRAWFSIFSLGTFIDGLGGLDEARAALEGFRRRAGAAGAGELHLDALGTYAHLAPEEIEGLGLDSVGTYGWGDHMPLDRGLTIDYDSWVAENEERGRAESARQRIPYVPVVTMGWDSTTRVHQDDELVLTGWPHYPVVVDATPEAFGASLTRAITAQASSSVPVVVVNAWNEWTEGSYLEPDERYGDGYLRALSAAVSATRSGAARS